MKFLNKKLEFLKKGSGIHIKKENRGKFTDYCGGKVTSECIAKGKRSSNPAIRKRATFAQNARHWKHQEGGTIINGSPIVTQHLQWLQNMPDYLAKKEELKKQKQLLEFQEAQQKQDFFGNLLGTAGNFLLNYLSKPKNDKDIQQSNSI